MTIPQRANRVLTIILLVMLIILARVWHLSVVQHKERVELARRPQRRERIEQAERGTIRDRFNLPLAVNRVQYNAAVLYSQVREVPRIRWLDKKRCYPRRDHIKNLSALLADMLDMDADRVEDLICSKAALFPNVPFVIKEGISEETFFRLKMLEREFLGLHAERVAERLYPQGAVAGNLIGHLGSISKEQYEEIASKVQQLEGKVAAFEEGKLVSGGASLEARRQLAELQERAYSTHDKVGKGGIEGVCEETLRGYVGKKVYQQDIYGTFVRELPGGKPSVCGNRVLLSLSAELQAYAEELLHQNEEIRKGRSHAFDRDSRTYAPLPQPWIKGGAIVVFEPNTGEVLTLASYPQCDPNAFDPDKLFETDRYIGEIWDGLRPMECDDKQIELTWERYLEMTGATEDLTKLVVENPELLEKVNQSLSLYRSSNQCANVITHYVRNICRTLYRDLFAEWRNAHGRAFLKKKRLEEKEGETYERPYLDYFDAAQKAQFADFWQRYKIPLVHLFLTGETPLPNLPFSEHFGMLAKEWREGAHRHEPWSQAYAKLSSIIEDFSYPLAVEYLQSMRTFADLPSDLQKLASAFYPRWGFGFGRSYAYQQATPQGSVFKVVPAYAALMSRYNRGDVDLNPLTMIDDVHRSRDNPDNWNVGFTLNRTPIPQRYKGGNLLRTHRRHVGQIDLVKALETSSNSYFGLLAVDCLDDPNILADTARLFSYGERTGIELPGEYAGQVPADLATNRTGLYSFVDGQHSLVVTPLQTAVMLSSLVNGGRILRPQLIRMTAGKEPQRERPFDRHTYAFRDTLALVGVELPLFTSRDAHIYDPSIAPFQPDVKRTLPMPDSVRNLLIKGMRQVVNGDRGGARPSAIRGYANYPWMIDDYRKLQDQIAGKTGTAEIVERVGLREPHIYNHIWFGCISFAEDQPELVVVVYLRFGDYGREAVPLAAQMIKKWREIKASRYDASHEKVATDSHPIITSRTRRI